MCLTLLGGGSGPSQTCLTFGQIFFSGRPPSIQPEDEAIESVQRETICDSNAVDVTLHLRQVNHLFLLLKSILTPDKH